MKAAVRSVKNFSKGYTDTQVKVRNATTNDAWGPSGSAMAEIAALTFDQNEMLEVVDIIDRRLNDKGKNWRHVFKSLSLLEYCLHSGSENVVRWAKDNIYIITTLREFVFVDEHGHDQGQNVRSKAKEISALLSDDESLREARRNRDVMQSRFRNGSSSPLYEESRYSRTPNRRDDEDEGRSRSRYRSRSRRPSGRSRSRRSRRPSPVSDQDDDSELRRVIEESKRQADEDARRRSMNSNSEADLQKAIQLSKEEEETRLRHQREREQQSPSLASAFQPVDFFGNPVQPQPTGFMQPQPTGFMRPQTTGFVQPQPTGFVYPQNTGFVQPQHTGVQPQHTGMMRPQHTGFMQPQHTGFVQPQHTGFSQPFDSNNPFPMMQPHRTGFAQPHPVQLMPPNHTGYVQPQSTGFRPQNTGLNANNPYSRPLQPQSTGYMKPQPTQPQPQPQPQLETTKTGSNNPFAQFAKLSPQPAAPMTAKPMRPVRTGDDKHANIAQAIASGNPNGIDSFGNIGLARLPSQHTGSRFTNSAGQTIQSQATGNTLNPFHTQPTGAQQQMYSYPQNMNGNSQQNMQQQSMQPQVGSLIDL
ncbi:epsin [Schizosaccharomyces octosporus yFS286]|uniref:Epsin n=1 Tax=Schizosaccharomyces octosporus (strain yFS286) TaxID=483514 RepID=S9PX94_SCHOY|nr:epsin [Schizosaccharomyces octosporus yFS286]EPX73691.1 epsin [Schizosaccharomyces octosporus yFS286]